MHILSRHPVGSCARSRVLAGAAERYAVALNSRALLAHNVQPHHQKNEEPGYHA